MNPTAVIAFLNAHVGRCRHFTAGHLGELVAGDRELVFGDGLARVDARLALARQFDTNEAGTANVGIGAAEFMDGVQIE